jgi:CBS-domain-containing membrane protein
MRHERIDPAEGPRQEQPAWAHGVSVGERMSRPAVTVADGATITEALRLMALNRVHYLPVLDDEARLVGIVDTDDVLGTRRTEGSPAPGVAAVMSSPVVSIGPAAPLSEAMRVMADRCIGALPVVDGGRVIGMLTQSDVVTALARQGSP